MPMMIQQGYVPSGCTLDDNNVGSMIIFAEVRDGRDPCAGCNADRNVCHGRPNTTKLLDKRDEIRREDAELDAKAKVEGILSPWEEHR